jgi:hypothetical protein
LFSALLGNYPAAVEVHNDERISTGGRRFRDGQGAANGSALYYQEACK